MLPDHVIFVRVVFGCDILRILLLLLLVLHLTSGYNDSTIIDNDNCASADNLYTLFEWMENNKKIPQFF